MHAPQIIMIIYLALKWAQKVREYYTSGIESHPNDTAIVAMVSIGWSSVFVGGFAGLLYWGGFFAR